MASGRPLRVFHLIKGLGRGGAEMLLAESLRCADRQRFTYAFGYFLPWKDALVATLRDQRVEVTCFNVSSSLGILRAVPRVAAHLRTWGADLVHCHLPVAGIAGRLAGRMAGIPVIYTEHNRMEGYHGLTRWTNLATWRWQRLVIAVSTDVARSVSRHTDSRVPLATVLNGVNVTSFYRSGEDRDRARRDLRIPVDAPVIGTVAVFREQKRLRDWLDAAASIRQRHPKAHFVLVGDGPQREELQARIGHLGLKEAVAMPGLREDVRPYVAAMDVYLMSSAFEGLPVALLEAMSMRCAVVATEVGGIPEVIDHGGNGLLVPPGRPDRLADSVCQLLHDPAELERLGQSARRTVEQRFSMSRMVMELEKHYERVFREASVDD